MSTVFNGTSRYSSDFQAIIDRALALASLPLTQMQQGVLRLNDEVTALTSLDSKVAGVKSSLSGFESALNADSLQASSSDDSVLTATTAAGAMEGSYTMEVVSLGSYSTRLSAAGGTPVTDPNGQSITASGTLTLEIDSDLDDALNALTMITISPAENTLKSLVDKINEKASEYVQATIVNVGTSAVPDYRLSLQSKDLGKTGIRLLDGGADLMTASSTTGSGVEYTLNGITLTSTSRTVEIAPNVSVSLLKETSAGSSVTLEITRSLSALQNSLTAFISSYNGTLDELDKARGSTLAGRSVITSVNDALKRAATFSTGSGALKSMSDIGLLFDKEGKLYLDTAILAESKTRFEDVKALIGDTEAGFLKAANDILESLTATTTGVIKSAIDSTSNSVTTQNQRISDESNRLADLEESLQQKMYEADAMIAMLEQQVEYFTGMFQAMKQASEVYSR